MLKQTTIFNVSFHLGAIFKKSFENSMILPAALSGRFLFLINWCLCVMRTLLLVTLSLTWTVVDGRRFRPSVAVVDGRRFQPTSGHLECISMSIMIGTTTIRTIDRRVEYVDNHQNYRSRSGICCRWKPVFLRIVCRGPESAVECKPVFLRVDGCCCISVHVSTYFCRCELRPVVLGDEKCQSVFFMMSPRECFVFVLKCQSVFFMMLPRESFVFVLQDS